MQNYIYTVLFQPCSNIYVGEKIGSKTIIRAIYEEDGLYVIFYPFMLGFL